MIPKPTSCIGCPLSCAPYGSMQGYVPQDGSGDNGVLIVLEAAGESEELEQKTVVGRAGQFMWSHLKPLGIEREGFRIHNVLSCRPPDNKLLKMPYTERAIEHCSPNLDRTIAEHVQHSREIGKTPIIVALGKFSFKRLMGIQSDKHPLMLEDYHSYPFWLEKYGCWLIAAPHPSHIMQGKNNLVPILQFVFQRALEIAEEGLTIEKPDYLLDPTPDQFRGWVDGYIRTLEADPINTFLSYDIETPYKSGKDESEVAKEDDDDYIILRCAFGYKPGVACSIPWQPEYMADIERLFGSKGFGLGWNNCPTPDQKILTADLRWVRADSLVVGDKLVCVDEEVPDGLRMRRFRSGEVTNIGRDQAEVFAVSFSDGSAVKVTGGHRWLIHPKDRPEGGKGSVWRSTDQLKVGQRLVRFLDKWETIDTRDAGYLAGFFDGEGHLAFNVNSKHSAFTVGATQNEGPTLDYAISLLQKIGYPHMHKPASPNNGERCYNIYLNGGISNKAKFLGSVRPFRLLNKFRPEALGATFSAQDTVTIDSIVSLGIQDIINIATDRKTYVLEGFIAHNCNYDDPRIRAQVPMNLVSMDGMLAWHVLNTSLPKGLGFCTPFYVKNTTIWKHLSTPEKGTLPDEARRQEAFYNAKDADMALRNWLGIKADLIEHNLWEVFDRHVVQLNKVLTYMSGEGVLLDKDARQAAEDKLQGLLAEINDRMQAAVPLEVRSLKIYKKEPRNADFSQLVKVTDVRITKQCPQCGAIDVVAAHFKSVGAKRLGRCVDCGESAKRHGLHTHQFRGEPEQACAGLKAQKVIVPAQLWAEPLPFKISKQSLTKYQAHKKHKPFKDRKTKEVTFDIKAIKQLIAKYPDDPLYPIIGEYRKVLKLYTTYIGRTIYKEHTVGPDYQLQPGESWADDPQAPHQGRDEDGEGWTDTHLLQSQSIDIEIGESGTESTEPATTIEG